MFFLCKRQENTGGTAVNVGRGREMFDVNAVQWFRPAPPVRAARELNIEKNQPPVVTK